jgi:hypothetical protein
MRGLGAFGPLLGLAAILAAFASLYVLLGKQPPQEFESLMAPCIGFFLVYWMVLDARRRHCVPCHDFGFLVAVFLPLSLPWYLVWTRGLRGLLLLGVFFAILIGVPWLCAVTAWMLKHGQVPW